MSGAIAADQTAAGGILIPLRFDARTRVASSTRAAPSSDASPAAAVQAPAPIVKEAASAHAPPASTHNSRQEHAKTSFARAKRGIPLERLTRPRAALDDEARDTACLFAS